MNYGKITAFDFLYQPHFLRQIEQVQCDFENREDSWILDQIMTIHPRYKRFEHQIFDIIREIVSMILYGTNPPFHLSYVTDIFLQNNCMSYTILFIS